MAFSAVSCTVTVLWLLPIFAIYPASFSSLRREMIPALLVLCFLVAIDITCSNISIALLSIPLQQVDGCAAPLPPSNTSRRSLLA